MSDLAGNSCGSHIQHSPRRQTSPAANRFAQAGPRGQTKRGLFRLVTVIRRLVTVMVTVTPRRRLVTVMVTVTPRSASLPKLPPVSLHTNPTTPYHPKQPSHIPKQPSHIVLHGGMSLLMQNNGSKAPLKGICIAAVVKSPQLISLTS